MPRRVKLVIASGAACVLCVVAMVAALLLWPREVVRFTPPPFDESAVAGVPALGEADGYMPIDAQEYWFALCGELAVGGQGTVDVWFTNDAANEAWLKVVLADAAGAQLGETGLVRPGEYVRSIALSVVPTKTTEVTMTVMGYEPQTYYSVGNVTLYTTLEVAAAEAA